MAAFGLAVAFLALPLCPPPARSVLEVTLVSLVAEAQARRAEAAAKFFTCLAQTGVAVHTVRRGQRDGRPRYEYWSRPVE